MSCSDFETTLKATINAYVTEQLEGFVPQKVQSAKVIHDSVHGTNLFDPYEVALLDLPFIQRLRRISQTDVASLVYPAGNHNRFEHTLGVTVMAGKMIDALEKREKIPIGQDLQSIRSNCRAAAIMHDSGHGPFSHLSEQIYSSQFAYEELKKKNDRFAGAKPHEINSYFIATSDRMKEFYEDVIQRDYQITLNPELIGDMIIGYSGDQNNEQAYLIEIINGAFDADKLDYLLRDAHSTGLRIALDIPRLMYTLNIIRDKSNSKNRLAIGMNGIAALEELLFDKMTLTSTLYHHQKVRAAGCLLKDIIAESGEFNSISDYLNSTDDTVYNLKKSSVESRLCMFKSRQLPKRAFCFSVRTLKPEKKKCIGNIIKSLDDKTVLTDLKQLIVAEVNDGVSVVPAISEDKIWIDSPFTPKFGEANECIVENPGTNEDCLVLSDLFPIDEWVRAFSENKWKGFVYTLPEYCEAVAKASKVIFEEAFDAEFNEFAFEYCKIDPDCCI